MKKMARILALVLSLVLVATSFSFAAGTGKTGPKFRTQKSQITHRSIKLHINDKDVTPLDANGNPTEPFILGGSTYLPVRAVAGALGLDVGWVEDTSTVTLRRGGAVKTGAVAARASNDTQNVEITYRDIKITLDGVNVLLVDANYNAVEPFILNGSTYLPVRAIGTALGCTVGWNEATNQVSLQDKSLRITSQPQNLTFTSGKTSTFTVYATGGTAPYTYQWYSTPSGKDNWTKITDESGKVTGAKTATLKVSECTADTQYRCRITDASGKYVESNAAKLTLDTTTFQITKQPVSVSTEKNKKASFTVTVSGGTKPYEYQWEEATIGSKSFKEITKKNNTNDAEDYNDATLVIPKNWSKEMRYRCTITDKKGKELTSNIVELTEGKELSLSTDLKDQTAYANDKVSFTVKATGGKGDYRYQWYTNSRKKTSGASKISGATSATYTISKVKSTDEKYYYCVVTDNKGNGESVESNIVWLTVSDSSALRISSDLTVSSSKAYVGESATFKVKVTSGQTPYYCTLEKKNGSKWDEVRDNPTDRNDTGSFEFTLSSLTTSDSGTYRCSLDSKKGSVTSKEVTLTVNERPGLAVTSPSNKTFKEATGTPVTFSVRASGGTGDYSYQWKVDKEDGRGWVNVGDDSPSLTISDATQADHGNMYKCVVTDKGDGKTVDSDYATLRFEAAPVPEPDPQPQPDPNQGGEGGGSESGSGSESGGGNEGGSGSESGSGN